MDEISVGEYLSIGEQMCSTSDKRRKVFKHRPQKMFSKHRAPIEATKSFPQIVLQSLKVKPALEKSVPRYKKYVPRFTSTEAYFHAMVIAIHEI